MGRPDESPHGHKETLGFWADLCERVEEFRLRMGSTITHNPYVMAYTSSPEVWAKIEEEEQENRRQWEALLERRRQRARRP